MPEREYNTTEQPAGSPRRAIWNMERMTSVRQKLKKLLASACALALALSTVPAAWAAPAFSDVGAGKWFQPYVEKAVDEIGRAHV